MSHGEPNYYGYPPPPSVYPPPVYPPPAIRTVKIICKGNTDMALAVRDDDVVMVYFDPEDPTQQWTKDSSWGETVQDSVGHPAFLLINEATGEALRHAVEAYKEVMVTKHEIGVYDPALMWTESEDMGEGYKAIRMANNIELNLDCYKGDISHGGLQEGKKVVLWTWNHQDNQLWKIIPIF